MNVALNDGHSREAANHPQEYPKMQHTQTVSVKKGGEVRIWLSGRVLPWCVSQALGSIPSNPGERGVKRRKEWRERG